MSFLLVSDPFPCGVLLIRCMFGVFGGDQGGAEAGFVSVAAFAGAGCFCTAGSRGCAGP